MNEQLNTPKVCIDGNAIRRVRESKKLTQLYIAKVVGVTTDTVSRWENNRYPSIRRDNALLLAEALEVDLDQILLNGTGEPGSAEDKSSKRTFLRSLLPVVIIISLAFAIYAFFMQRQPTTYAFTAARLLPTFAVANGNVPVRIRLEATGAMKGMILREHFPKGWKLLQASPPPSSLDNVDGMARWIIKPDERPAVISYLVQVPKDVDSNVSYKFSGAAIINPRGSGVTYSIDGDSSIQIGPFHWADANGDSIIDDGETLTASDSVDEMEKLHLSWETIEKIWDAGKYKWDPEQGEFIPVRNPAASQN